ncbi:hypothetical protein JJJ17_05835 [Paracoccus caeni]|uniref:Uncharacterized protein n=1 Tax=Paracoccus caeni TaxID=657651 RepID=A0A934SJ83_9RHOB|nr:hypothetical protein [Paracoccus caeni]MBK4215443.1 hypothetical protein [Paracoccus caeni]
MVGGIREARLATAEFSKDMVETMLTYFDQYAEDGVLTIEVTQWGLWLPHPETKSRQFLGLAKLPDYLKQ